jgi:hypothetical protein
MKKILATVLAAGALLAAAPIAAASPGVDRVPMNDETFLSVLDNFGLEYTSAKLAIEVAGMVCDAADAGNSLTRITRVIAEESAWTRTESRDFVMLATSVYCPEFSA